MCFVSFFCDQYYVTVEGISGHKLCLSVVFMLMAIVNVGLEIAGSISSDRSAGPQFPR